MVNKRKLKGILLGTEGYDLTQNQLHALEDILDKSSMRNVLDALGEICYEKAEHIRINWQDEPLAKLWDKQGGKLKDVDILV